jgi:hypothetical protein
VAEYRIWAAGVDATVTTTTGHADDFTWGNEFYVTEEASATVIWYYISQTGVAIDEIGIYRVDSASTGVLLDGTHFTVTTSGTGWQGWRLPAPVPLAANQRYRVVVLNRSGNYPFTVDYWEAGFTGGNGRSNGPLFMPGENAVTGTDGTLGPQSSYNRNTNIGYPTNRSGGNGWVDVTVVTPYRGAAELVADSALSAAGHEVGQGTAELAADSIIEATGAIAPFYGAAELAADSDLAATGLAVPQGSAELAADTTLYARGDSYRAQLIAESDLDAVGTAVPQGAAELAADSTLEATGTALPAPAYYGALDRVEFYALNADGTIRAPLPDVKTWVLSPLLADAGSVRLTYPTDGLNFAILHENVTQDRDLTVAVAINGRIQDRLQAILSESDGDDVAHGAVWAFSGNFTAQWLTEAIVAPKAGMPSQGTDTASENDAHFYSVTAGTIMRTLLAEANNRGALTHIDWTSFTNDTDSNGVTWSQIITLKFAPGLSLLDVAKALVSYGMCEFEMLGSSLRLYEGTTHSTDRTLTDPPVIFRAGRDLSDSPRKHSVRDTATALLAAGGDGIYHTESDATALAKRGRRIEAFSSQGNITDGGVLAGYAQTALAGLVNGTMEKTHGLVLEGPQPLRDYQLGDWAWSDVGAGLERLRIKHLTISGDDTGAVTGSVTLNDLIAEREAAMARRIQGIEGGTTVTGTSQARVRPEDLTDTVAPAPPASLQVTSLAYTVQGSTLAAVTATWPETGFNTDGTAVDDLHRYIVAWRYTDPNLNSSFVGWMFQVGDTAPELSWSGVKIAEQIEVKVTAQDKSGNWQGYSPAVLHTTASDDTAPPTPSALAVSTLFGSMRLEWDGLGSAGEAMPPDFAQAEIHASQVSGFTADATTFYTQLGGAGATTYTKADYGVTVYFRLVAVDHNGNRSAASAQASGTARQVLEPDVFDGAIGSAKLADAAIITAKIADLAVNDAKIADLSVGKLTAGTMSADTVLGANIATALTGPRVGMNTTGFYAYDTTRQTVSIGNDGKVYCLGEFATETSGERIVINPGGVNPRAIQFFPDTTANYALIRAVSYTDLRGNKHGLVRIIASKDPYDGKQSYLTVWPGSVDTNSTYLFSRGLTTAYSPVGASEFNVLSSRDKKIERGEITTGVLDLFDRSPATIWNYSDDPGGVAHIGPMADGIPQQFWRHEPEGGELVINIDDKIGIVWEVLRRTRLQLRTEIADLRQRVTALEGGSP